MAAEGGYDNTNKGSLWPMNGFRGKFDIGGGTFYMLMVGTGASRESKAPAYKAIISNDGHDSVVPVWRDDKAENKRVGYFEYAEHNISIFDNGKQEKVTSPRLGLMVHPKSPATMPHVDNSDDCPF